MTVFLSRASDSWARAQRLAEAAETAIARIVPGETARMFAPVGESLVWLIALDDLLVADDPRYRAFRDADIDGQVLGGIRYARNAAIHGEEVAETTFTNPGAVLGAASLPMVLGSGPFSGWMARNLIPHVPTPSKYLAAQEVAYDSFLAGEPLKLSA